MQHCMCGLNCGGAPQLLGDDGDEHQDQGQCQGQDQDQEVAQGRT